LALSGRRCRRSAMTAYESAVCCAGRSIDRASAAKALQRTRSRRGQRGNCCVYPSPSTARLGHSNRPVCPRPETRRRRTGRRHIQQSHARCMPRVRLAHHIVAHESACGCQTQRNFANAARSSHGDRLHDLIPSLPSAKTLGYDGPSLAQPIASVLTSASYRVHRHARQIPT
jgi:hypothetical protein